MALSAAADKLRRSPANSTSHGPVTVQVTFESLSKDRVVPGSSPMSNIEVWRLRIAMLSTAARSATSGITSSFRRPLIAEAIDGFKRSSGQTQALAGEFNFPRSRNSAGHLRVLVQGQSRPGLQSDVEHRSLAPAHCHAFYSGALGHVGNHLVFPQATHSRGH